MHLPLTHEVLPLFRAPRALVYVMNPVMRTEPEVFGMTKHCAIVQPSDALISSQCHMWNPWLTVVPLAMAKEYACKPNCMLDGNKRTPDLMSTIAIDLLAS